jgi:methylase of polypeptide subunit release factors
LYTKRKSIDGGKYGLDKIWELIRKSAENLKMNGYLIFTTKRNQADFLGEYFANHGGIVHNFKIDSMKLESEGDTVIMVLQKIAQKKVETETTESD